MRLNIFTGGETEAFGTGFHSPGPSAGPLGWKVEVTHLVGLRLGTRSVLLKCERWPSYCWQCVAGQWWETPSSWSGFIVSLV